MRAGTRQAAAFSALAGAVAVLGLGFGWLEESESGVGWQVATALIPLAVAAWMLGRPLVRDRRVLLGGGFLPFLIVYCALFAIADEVDLLDGERTPLAGFDRVPSNRYGLNGLGDWHYRVLREPTGASDLIVVRIPADESELLRRRRFASLIRLAADAGARGVALDFYLEGSNPFDRRLCRAVEDAAPALPVIFGYRHEAPGGQVRRIDPPEGLAGCLTHDRLASLAGYQESDGVVRMVPVRMPGAPRGCGAECESLSVRAARLLGPVGLPASGLIQFTDLPAGVPRIEGWPDEDDARLLRHRLVLVGCCAPGSPEDVSLEDETSRDAGERDVWDTPYGRLAGVEIHARAVHSLAGGERKLILRADDRITILLIFLLAYALALIQYRGAGWKVLLAAAVLMSIGVVAGAAVAMRHGLLWLDVSYVLSAIWGLAPMLKGGALIQHQVRVRRRIVQARLQEAQAEAPEIAPARTHQVLISYSRKDAEVVRRIADGLEQRSLSVWIDERRIAHGARWLAQLQRILRTAESALLMMGPHGVGRWQEAEIEECLIEARERGMRVIPVLLPEGPDPGALPPFVRSLNALDARFGFLERHLDAMTRAVRPDEPVRQRLAA